MDNKREVIMQIIDEIGLSNAKADIIEVKMKILYEVK
jgi:hypothetical protein